jgi:hypothetical protein
VGKVFCSNCGAVGKRHLGLAVVFRPTGVDPQPHEWRDHSEYEAWKASTTRLPIAPAPGHAVALTSAGSRLIALIAGLAVAVAPVIAIWRLTHWELMRREWASAIGPVLAYLAFAVLGSRALPKVLPKLGFPAWHARLLWVPVVGGLMLGRWAWRWADDPSATLS